MCFAQCSKKNQTWFCDLFPQPQISNRFMLSLIGNKAKALHTVLLFLQHEGPASYPPLSRADIGPQPTKKMLMEAAMNGNSEGLMNMKLAEAGRPFMMEHLVRDHLKRDAGSTMTASQPDTKIMRLENPFVSGQRSQVLVVKFKHRLNTFDTTFHLNIYRAQPKKDELLRQCILCIAKSAWNGLPQQLDI